MIKEIRNNLIVTFIISFIVGILLLFATEEFLQTINYVLVSLFAIIGVVEIINFFVSKSYKKDIYYSLYIAILCFWLAMFFYIYYTMVIMILPIMLSIYAFGIGTLILIRYLKTKNIIYIIGSILSFIMGVILLAQASLTVNVYLKISGIYILATSILYLIEYIDLKKEIKKLK